jgi:trimeric autotransporter adhesin
MNILRDPRAQKLATRFLTLVLVAIGSSCLVVSHAQAQCTDAAKTRPLLFVHGLWESSTAWGTTSERYYGIRDTIIGRMAGTYGYPLNSTDYDLYFDGTNVRYSQQQGNPNLQTDPIASSSNIPCDARFFSIIFFGWDTFDASDVANVSIITKAFELSEVIKAITGITFVKDVIVVAHSLGALDSRAYIENFGSALAPCIVLPCYDVGSLPYTNDIGHLITVNGANAGTNAGLTALYGWFGTNVAELAYNSNIIQAINYNRPYTDAGNIVRLAALMPSGLSIDAVIDEYSDVSVFCTLKDSQSCFTDGILASDSQSITKPLANFPNVYDTTNEYLSTDQSIVQDSDCWIGEADGFAVVILHLLPCLSDPHTAYSNNVPEQAVDLVYSKVIPNTVGQLSTISIQTTYNSGQMYEGSINLTLSGPIENGSTTITNPQQMLSGPSVPPSPILPTWPPSAPIAYNLSYVSGGPAGAGPPTITATNAAGEVCSPCYITSGISSVALQNWSITFNVVFPPSTLSAPTVTTSQPTSIAGDSATLVGTVNPGGSATTAWFEWGTTSSLGQVTPVQYVGSGTGTISAYAAITGLESNTTYYYRIDATNATGTSYGPSIVPFSTLTTLPAPVLASPASGGSNISVSPTFSWSAVGGAASYRLIVATTPGALPSDPTSSSCGAGCILDVTPIGTSYSVLNGILQAGTTYYWEVHARGILQYGNWSTVSSFTTSGPTLTSVTISPSAITSGSSATVTATLNGPAPQTGAQITLTTTNSPAFPVPANLLITSGSTSGSTSVQAGTVSSSTTVTVTGSYNGSVASAAETVSPSGGSVFLSSFTIAPPSIVGGFSTQGNVFLTGPAPVGGAVVSLSSNNTQFVQVPPSQSVTVQPGYTSAGFPITTSFTGGTVGATINASYNNTMYGAAVTVLPLVAAGVTFYPSSVDAGSPAPFTVYLNGPAPAGASISLTSSNPSVLQVPGAVSVPTGSTSVSVTGTTFAISSQTNVTVTANYNGGSAQGSLTVVPLSLIGFSLTPLEITGGSSVTGTVWLSDIAPSGGVNVSLSSASSLVQVPSTANVAAGSSSATFTATTSGVSSVTNVIVTASYNGVSYNLTLTLVPPLPYLASLTFAPATVDSGSATIGTVTLTSPAPLGGAAMSLTGSFYAVANVPNGVTVQSGAMSATFTVTTSPIGFISTVTVKATYNGTTQSALITVVPPGTPLAPSSLTLNPSVVTGGFSSTATILLTGPAPTGGAVLTLSSDNAGVQVPPVLTVPAGLNSAVFTATTSSVSDTATATIKATYGGLAESSLLTVEPSGTPPNGNPVPFLAPPLAPASQNPGGAGLTLTVNGSGFVPGVQASWNGTAVSTTYVSASQMQVSIPSGSTQTNGSGVVTVTNPGPVNPASNALVEYLTYPTSVPSFNTASLTSTDQPANVVVGDLNRDGKPDLIVGNYFTGLSVFLGNGDGTFGAELLLQASSPAAVIGDFNGDGKPDIVTTAGSSVRLYLGNGDGTFTSTADTPFASGYVGNTSLAVGDFNGDGKLDVAVTGNDLTQAYILLGNGDGTFGAPASVGSVNQPFGVAVTDFNGDGKLDLALADTGSSNVAILLGNGDGTFQPQIEYPTNGYPYSLAVADFNNDQRPDIAVSNYGPVGGTGGGVSVLINNGNGTFAAPVNYSPGGEFYFLTAGDVNGDNKLDLVVSSLYPNQATLLFLGNGDGTFSSAPITLASGTASDFNTVADLNGDGAPDVVIPNYVGGSGNISILLQSVLPVLQVTPSSLSFTATQGAGSPSPLSVAIANSGGGTETWTATTSQPWVVLGQTSGTAPSTVSVSVNPAGLNPGTYTATITVTATGASNSPQVVTVTLAVNAATVVVSSLTFSPNSLTGAGTATGTVTLSGSAPVGGASVSLSSNNSVVQVPATVTVPFGLVSSTFTATASSVTTQTIVTVTATYSGVSTTATLTLNPNTTPLTVSPTALSYGNQGISSTSAAKKVTLTNNTGAIVTISSMLISGTNSADFAQSATTCGTTLGLNASCTVSITFTPAAPGARSATLTITDSAVNSPQTVALSGTGVLQVTLSTASFAFGNQADGTTSTAKTVTVTNNTSAALTISSTTITGTNASEFEVSSNTCGSNIGGHSSCKVSVKFAPVTPGAKTASLTIVDSANNSPQSVSLTGTGIVPVSVTPSSLTFAAQKVGTKSPAKVVTIKNNLPTALTMSGNTFTGANAADFAQSSTTCGTTLAAGKSCTANITFTPTAKGSRVAVLNVKDSATTSPQTVSLSGTGK